MILQTWQLVVVALAGWMNQQQDVVAYLAEENRVLREQFGGKRIRFTDDQRRRLSPPASERHHVNSRLVRDEVDRGVLSASVPTGPPSLRSGCSRPFSAHGRVLGPYAVGGGKSLD